MISCNRRSRFLPFERREPGKMAPHGERMVALPELPRDPYGMTAALSARRGGARQPSKQPTRERVADHEALLGRKYRGRDRRRGGPSPDSDQENGPPPSAGRAVVTDWLLPRATIQVWSSWKIERAKPGDPDRLDGSNTTGHAVATNIPGEADSHGPQPNSDGPDRSDESAATVHSQASPPASHLDFR